MPDRYAIIIPAYNEEAFLPATLKAAREAMDAIPDAQGEIIVVDNHSTDRTAEVAREHGADQVVHEPFNQISRARNTGARAALRSLDCDRLIFLDADTHPPPAMLRQALEALASGEVCGGGAIIVSDQPLPFAVHYFLAAWNWCAPRFGMAAGCFIYCRRDGFESVGGFDETVYAGEEVWFSRRLRRWGKRRGLAFRVFSEPPIVTSGRKSEWFSAWQFTRQLGLLMICPWAGKSRRLCALWYRRPASSS